VLGRDRCDAIGATVDGAPALPTMMARCLSVFRHALGRADEVDTARDEVTAVCNTLKVHVDDTLRAVTQTAQALEVGLARMRTLEATLRERSQALNQRVDPQQLSARVEQLEAENARLSEQLAQTRKLVAPRVRAERHMQSLA
jgi:cell division protein FtsB